MSTARAEGYTSHGRAFPWARVACPDCGGPLAWYSCPVCSRAEAPTLPLPVRVLDLATIPAPTGRLLPRPRARRKATRAERVEAIRAARRTVESRARTAAANRRRPGGPGPKSPEARERCRAAAQARWDLRRGILKG